MQAEQHDRVLARVRHRFATTLESRIRDSIAAISPLPGDAPSAGKDIGDTYRRLHDIVAVGPTVGFPATGRAARAAEAIVLEAYHRKRGITDSEAASLRKALDALWATAQTELRLIR